MLHGVESGVVRLSRSVPADEVHEGTGPTERRVDTRLIRRSGEIDYSTVVGSDDKAGERRPAIVPIDGRDRRFFGLCGQVDAYRAHGCPIADCPVLTAESWRLCSLIALTLAESPPDGDEVGRDPQLIVGCRDARSSITGF